MSFQSKNLKIIGGLLDEKADVNLIMHQGRSCFLEACMLVDPSLEMVKLIVEKGKADINSVSNLGEKYFFSFFFKN